MLLLLFADRHLASRVGVGVFERSWLGVDSACPPPEEEVDDEDTDLRRIRLQLSLIAIFFLWLSF